jgi:endonuclease/exonuclease/phosphatase (EEP) superfamily protein YafD
MILVKKHLPILDHIHIEENNVELVLAKKFSHETEVAILNLYAAPHATFSNIVHVISNALTHFHLNGPIVLVGDFNIDMLQNIGRTKELENYMCKYSLRFLMNNTVHLQNALIDHVWSNVPIPQYSMLVLDTYWSNHDTIGIALEL